MSSEKQEENSWLIDLILSFFHSPEWKAPVLSFIEEKCIVFDDEEENKLEYTVIHKEFKQLAEGLIEAMLWELGATPEMFAEAFEKAKDTPGYQKITKIIESIDSYEIFAKMMRKKNASLNEAAFKMLQREDEQITKPIEYPTKPVQTKGFEETKKSPPVDQTRKDRKQQLQEKKNFGRLNTLEEEELSSLEKEQMELLKSISLREEEERRKIEEEEEKILQQVLELSSKEHEEELKRKESDIEEKEKKLREREQQLKREEDRIKREKEEFQRKKTEDLEREKLTKKQQETKPGVENIPTPPVTSGEDLSKKKDKPKKKKKIISESSEKKSETRDNTTLVSGDDSTPTSKSNNLILALRFNTISVIVSSKFMWCVP